MKNKKLKDFTNYKMDSEVYKLRRKVINLIYELKNEGFNLPRVDVRVGESKKCNVLGLAVLKDNIIWITKTAINRSEKSLYHTVLHELIHTIFGCEHNEKCHLMKACEPKEILSKDKLLEIFRKYYNKYNNLTNKQMEV